MARHPCERGRRCVCHRAGPSTPRPKKTILLATAAALVCPVLAAPTPPFPTTLPFLYPSLDKRAKDAGQAPDDPSEGFTHQHIQLADLIRAGLPYKYVFDPEANPTELEEEIEERNGAWVMDNAWSLHGRRFGPLYATATAGITDDPLPTPTESVPPASTPTPSTSSTAVPTVLAIQSSLPTGWDSSQYERSEMYAIPLVVSFALVIALMIGSLIGALVIRRDRSRSRRRKKLIKADDDSAAREKVVQSSLVSRVGRVLKHRDDEEEEEEENPRAELEQRVKVWARRSAAWRAQARGMRRRIGRRKRSQADSGPAMGGAIQEEPEAEEREARNSTRASSPAVQSRAPTPIVTDHNEPGPASAAPNYSSPVAPNYATPGAPNYASPVVPTYSSSSAAGPSTPLARTEPRSDQLDAHADATPSDEPAYDGPGSGEGLPPAYRGGGLSEVARGKRPAHVAEPIHEPEPERPQERRVWTELDAYAFSQEPEVGVVTAHVATDDKRVLERLHSMRGAPEEEREEGEGQVQAPREEDVFGVGSGPSTPGSVPSVSTGRGLPSATTVSTASEGGGLPLPPTKTGTGPVARYGEADLCLPRYLDGEGMVPSAPGEEEAGIGEVETGGMVPSAPPCEEEIVLPSAPVLEERPSAPPLEDSEPLAPSAPPADGRTLPSAPLPDDYTFPSAPPIDDHTTPSAPPADDHASPSVDGHPSPSAPPVPSDDLASAPLQHDTHSDDKPSLHPPPSPSAPHLRTVNSSSPLLTEEQ